MGKVLIVGYITELMEKRNRALRAARHKVTQAGSFSEASTALKEHNFDVLVLGQGVPEEERNNLSRMVKQTHPRTRIVMLHCGSIKNAELADAIIHATADLNDLVRTLDYLLGTEARAQTGS